MPTPLAVSVVAIQDGTVTVATPDGQRWLIPSSAIMGQPALQQTLSLLAVAPGAESSAQHPLAHALLEQLLDTSA